VVGLLHRGTCFVSESLLDAIARLAGISASYADAFGRRIEVSEATKRAILGAFGLSCDDEEGARASLTRIEAIRGGPTPPVISVVSGQESRLTLRGMPESARWTLEEEAGERHEGQAPSGIMALPSLPLGYHRLTVEIGGDVHRATLIAAPALCWQPEMLDAGERLWGATAQVYALRSPGNHGIGDYSDVARVAAGIGHLGGSFLGLSPVHALFSSDRTKFSPYSPSSRLFLETNFIDPSAVPGFGESRAAALTETAEHQERLRAARESALVDHDAAWTVKRPLLEALWRERDWAADPDFRTFRQEGGAALERHATFEALSDVHRADGRWWLGDWPEQHRSADSPAVDAFKRAHGERVGFHAWLQWLADLQMAAAARAARAAGMPIGLYRDLAVGADRAGSEIWAHPDRFATGLSAGAPPDPLGPQGQNWGLPPFNPLALEEQSLAAFRDLVVANMRHAGAIRIDHVFQLQRLYVVPEGMSAAEGAYVDMPFEAMLAVLRLESHRHCCMVIGEDLGTAPEGFSDAIMSAGVSSYRVVWFERDGGGHGGGAEFTRPANYPRRALAVFTTHDLPTFVGWWRGVDVDLRQSLGIFDHETAERERQTRADDRAHFCAGMAEEGVLASPDPPETPPLEAMTRFLARTASSLVALQLEDALGEPYQANLPGPEIGHPNWRRRLSAEVDTVIAPGGDLAKLAAVMASEGRSVRTASAGLASPPPRATYRLQFHAGFTFDDAARIVPYLARLGVSHLYASPIQTARPGSTHGYDIVDHGGVNPELGGEEGFRRLTDTLREHGLGLVLDIVPNHMGVGGADNAWWLSVLEWGEASPHARAFDIDWERLGANRKLVVPVLGQFYGDALEQGELKLSFDPEEGGFSVHHWEHRLPIVPTTYPIVLDRALAVLDATPEPSRTSLLAASERLRAMGDDADPDRRRAFAEEAQQIKRRLCEAAAASPAVREAIDRAAALINGEVGVPESFGTLHRILELQSYRLAHWRVAASDINYRRFFDINGLAGLRVEDPDVFAATHELIFRLVREGRIQGLRIDHIDGLADPEGYARALQEAIGPGFYVVVEKILEPGEDLRSWPVAGTTGYDVLNLIDGIFVETGNAAAIDRIYRDRAEIEGRYGALLRSSKAEILETSFASELEVLVSDAKRIADADRRTRDYTMLALRRALVEIVARFPVYRTYLGEGPIAPEDRDLVEQTVAKAKSGSVLPDLTVHDFVASALLGGIETEGPGRPDADLVRRFRRRFQQVTGPVMAKSLEDTLFYRYVPLLALNEVGGDPNHFGGTLDAFHAANAARAVSWPDAMIATATHDTKRGEDARARLLALSEMPDVWAEALDRFDDLTAGRLVEVDGELAPDANDRILLFQAILGAWPFELLSDDQPEEACAAFRDRLQGFIEKALREAKRHTSWVHVKETYEAAAKDLCAWLMSPKSGFLQEFRLLARRLSADGIVTGLSRTVLKATLPGVPDTYQGTEFWDLSLVDPDNRRAVDYESRERALADGVTVDELVAHAQDGRLKQHILARLLADRAERPGLYADGDYTAVPVRGSKARHVAAFLRRRGDDQIFVATSRLADALGAPEQLPLGEPAWGDTAVALPPGRWRDIVTDREFVSEGDAAVADLFAVLPITVLRGSS
jgi:(1->4)-alpha-D-glucan 1-alpha-D-glucosylmutase